MGEVRELDKEGGEMFSLTKPFFVVEEEVREGEVRERDKEGDRLCFH